VLFIIGLAGLASHRLVQLSSNVRRQNMRTLAILAAAVFSSPTYASDLPAGWRAPTASEQVPSGGDWRSDSPARFLSARGNFFGSGHQSEARVLVRVDGVEAGLHVKAPDGQWIAALLFSVKSLATTGLSTFPAGDYKTACGKGYSRCEPGEPPEIKLKHEAMQLFTPESSSSVIVWNRTSKSFVQVWLSD